MTETGLRRIGDTVDLLGEGPVWDVAEQALYWVDIRGPAVRRFDERAGQVQTWTMPDLVGCLGLREGGGLIVALRTQLAFWSPELGVAPLESHGGHAGMRFNDGRCDRQGRFWAGTMNHAERGREGALFRYDGRLTPVVEGVDIPNSLCWSPDGGTMYFADSVDHAIYAYQFDPASGEIGARRVFARTEPPAAPDGATVDRDGFVWSAQYGGGRVVRYAPDGNVDRVIELPVTQPTSVAFGGPALRTLFITTATQNLTDAARAAQPWAGALLAVDEAGEGLPEPRFAG